MSLAVIVSTINVVYNKTFKVGTVIVVAPKTEARLNLLEN
jgi:hypothetical protein